MGRKIARFVSLLVLGIIWCLKQDAPGFAGQLDGVWLNADCPWEEYTVSGQRVRRTNSQGTREFSIHWDPGRLSWQWGRHGRLTMQWLGIDSIAWVPNMFCEHSRVWRWRRVCSHRGHGPSRREHRSRSRSRNWHRCYRRRPIPHDSKYAGVTWHPRLLKWQAHVKDPDMDVPLSLGLFSAEKDAAKEYDCAKILLEGENAVVNLPWKKYSRAEIANVERRIFDDWAPRPSSRHGRCATKAEHPDRPSLLRFLGVYKTRNSKKWKAEIEAVGGHDMP
eukprot:Skav227648  [mRNA]  locus=scaffold58:312575:320810:+ [translate_table: standard]